MAIKHTVKAADIAKMSATETRSAIRRESSVRVLSLVATGDPRNWVRDIARARVEALQSDGGGSDPDPDPPADAQPALPGLDDPPTDVALRKVARKAAKLHAETEAAQTAEETFRERAEAAAHGAAPKPKPKPRPKPRPTVAQTERKRRSPFSDAEIAAAIERYGQTVICPKCNKAGDLMEDFGLRRMRNGPERQAQCRACRNAASRASIAKHKKAAQTTARRRPKRRK